MADKLVKCEIVRDYWDADGNRHRAGSVVDVLTDTAMEGLEQGILKRVKKGAAK